jgi:hypothetical protein
VILAEHSLTLDENNTARIYPIGDMHMTLRTFREKDFRRYIQTIADDPAGMAVIMGDISDARSRDHKFFAPEMIASRYQIEDIDILEDKAAEEAADLLTPIAGKIAGILRGNHHLAGFTHTLRRELRHRAEVNVPDLGDRALIRVPVDAGRGRSEFTLTIFATHRDSGGKKPGAQLNQQVDVTNWCHADLYLFAHSHRSSFYRQPRIGLQGRGLLKVKRSDALLINAGAWLEPLVEGSNSYADSFNLPLQNDDKYFAEVSFKTHSKDVRLRHRVWE